MTASLTPMDILTRISPAGAKTYMEHRGAIMDNPELQALPLKTKLLVGLGVAASLQSSTCTLMWTKQAKQAGASEAEIAEALLVNDAAAEALQWLAENR